MKNSKVRSINSLMYLVLAIQMFRIITANTPMRLLVTIVGFVFWSFVMLITRKEQTGVNE